MAQEIENIALAAQEDNGESIGIKDIWQLSLAKWQWFIYCIRHLKELILIVQRYHSY